MGTSTQLSGTNNVNTTYGQFTATNPGPCCPRRRASSSDQRESAAPRADSGYTDFTPRIRLRRTFRRGPSLAFAEHGTRATGTAVIINFPYTPIFNLDRNY